jgi:hypothetical protein
VNGLRESGVPERFDRIEQSLGLSSQAVEDGASPALDDGRHAPLVVDEDVQREVRPDGPE